MDNKNQEFTTLILRFRDLVTETGGTIKMHQEIINKHKYVWWGWWKKEFEKAAKEFYELESKVPLQLYLVDSGTKSVYCATCEELKIFSQMYYSPEKVKTPKYYNKRKYYVWFKLSEIELYSGNLNEFSYINTPSLFSDSNIDYSMFDNKKIYSVEELIQQNRTVWFIRDAVDEDAENEIVLLNSEYVRPGSFISKYYQSSGDTLLWMSDLHLPGNWKEENKKGLRKSLAEHICGDFQSYEGNCDRKSAGLLISGDITSNANKEGFESATLMLKDLNSQFTSIDERSLFDSNNILICPGNHDFAYENQSESQEADYIKNNSETVSGFSNFYKSVYHVAPNQYFATGRKIVLSSGYLLEIAALNSLMIQQSSNFSGHGFLSVEQLEYVKKEMEWDKKAEIQFELQ